MKITGLKYRSGGLFAVVIEEKETFFLEDITVHGLGLKKDMELGEELYDEIKDISGKEGAKRSVARILATGQKSSFQIKQKLALKGFSKEHIDEAVAFFEEKGFIDDEKYAESYVKDAVTLKNHGAAQIKHELAKRGISADIISRATQELDDGDQLKNLIEKEMKKNPDKKGIEKLKRRLFSKGFGLWDINRALGEYENET